MAFIIILLFLGVVAAASDVDMASNETLNQVYSTATFEILKPVCSVISTCLRYLHLNLDLPPLVLWIWLAIFLLCYLPPQPQTIEAVGVIAAIPFQCIAKIYQVFLDHQQRSSDEVLQLERKIASYEDGTLLPENLSDTYIKITQVEDTTELVQNLLAEHGKLVTANNELVITKKTLENNLERARAETDLVRSSNTAQERFRTENMYQLQNARMQGIWVETTAKNKALESKVTYWKSSFHSHKYRCSEEARRKLDEEIKEQRTTVGDLQATNAALTEQVRNLNARIYKLEPEKSTLDGLKKLMHRMSQDEDLWSRLGVTIFITAMKKEEANLATFGIEPVQFETYYKWAQDLVTYQESRLDPKSGFSLHVSSIGSSLAAGQMSEPRIPLSERVSAPIQITSTLTQVTQANHAQENHGTTAATTSQAAHSPNNQTASPDIFASWRAEQAARQQQQQPQAQEQQAQEQQPQAQQAQAQELHAQQLREKIRAQQQDMKQAREQTEARQTPEQMQAQAQQTKTQAQQTQTQAEQTQAHATPAPPSPRPSSSYFRPATLQLKESPPSSKESQNPSDSSQNPPAGNPLQANDPANDGKESLDASGTNQSPPAATLLPEDDPTDLDNFNPSESGLTTPENEPAGKHSIQAPLPLNNSNRPARPMLREPMSLPSTVRTCSSSTLLQRLLTLH